MAREERQYTAADLYGADGRPRAADIDQDDIYNCYFLAPMGSLGERQPDRIRDAIRFNAETGDFTVSLYRPPNAQERDLGRASPIQESITVSQEDIRRNISERGGGTVDNNRARNGPLWPTVIEAGFAELYGRNSKGEVNLGQGYRTIGAATGGGSLADSVYALTGESGRSLQILNPNAPPMQPTGPDHVKRSEPPPFRAPLQGAKLGLDAVYAEVEQALTAGRPVSMATQGRDVRDGLEESHAYMVVGLSRDPQSGEALITLRNPYANNQRVGEGDQNIGAGWNASNPEITVSLNRLVRDGSFGEFNIGPAPRVQSQKQGISEPATPSQPASGSPAKQVPTNAPNAPANDAVSPAAPAPAPLSLADPRDPNHTDHRLYKQIETGVARIDAEKGRVFDQSSERLTMCAFCDTKAAGITSAGHIAINETGKRQQDGSQIAAGTLLFVVQGQDPSDPAARRSVTDVAQAVERPVEQSLQKVDALTQQQTQLLAQQQNQPAQDESVRTQRMA
jgi:hypothetical protein